MSKGRNRRGCPIDQVIRINIISFTRRQTGIVDKLQRTQSRHALLDGIHHGRCRTEREIHITDRVTLGILNAQIDAARITSRETAVAQVVRRINGGAGIDHQAACADKGDRIVIGFNGTIHDHTEVKRTKTANLRHIAAHFRRSE